MSDEKKYDDSQPVQVPIRMLDGLASLHREAPKGESPTDFCEHCNANAHLRDLRAAVAVEQERRRKILRASTAKLN